MSMIRQKSQAELSEQLASVEPAILFSTEAGHDLSLSDFARYKTIHGKFCMGVFFDRSDPESAKQHLAEAYSDLRGDAEKSERDFLEFGGPFAAALRKVRKQEDKKLKNKQESFIKHSTVAPQEREEAEKRLIANTIDLTGEPEQSLIENLFPSGNWLLHSTGAEQIVKCLDSGQIKTTATLVSEDSRNLDKSVGGSFGVSWNFNEAEIVLGDPRHYAGFMADPETLLEKQGGMLAVPAKSCFNEVQYYGSEPDTIYEIRDLETLYGIINTLIPDLELMNASLLGEKVLQQFAQGDPNLLKHMTSRLATLQTLLANPPYSPQELRKAYIAKNGSGIIFSSVINKMKPGSSLLVMLQAMADGKFGEQTQQALQGNVPNTINAAWMTAIKPSVDGFLKDFDAQMRQMTTGVGHSSAVNIENVVFYCPKKDYESWLKVLAASKHIPRGIIVYDGSRMRARAGFADGSLDNDGQTHFQAQLQQITDPEKKLDWNSFFVNNQSSRNHTESHYLVHGSETATAGVMILQNGRPAIKSLDDIDED